MRRPVAFTLLLIFMLVLIIFFADLGAMPQMISSLYAFPYGDLVGHLLLMGLLSLFVNLSLACRRIKIVSRSFLLGIVILLPVVTLEELSQLFLNNRSFSILDLAFSYAGILVFAQLAVLFQKSVFSKKSLSQQ